MNSTVMARGTGQVEVLTKMMMMMMTLLFIRFTVSQALFEEPLNLKCSKCYKMSMFSVLLVRPRHRNSNPTFLRIRTIPECMFYVSKFYVSGFEICLPYRKILPQSYFLFLNHLLSILVCYSCHFPLTQFIFLQLVPHVTFNHSISGLWMDGPGAVPVFGILQGFHSECAEPVELRRGMHCLSLACSPINQLRFKNKQTKTCFILLSINADFYKLILKSS